MMTAKKIIAVASGILITSTLVGTFYINNINQANAQSKGVEQVNIKQGNTSLAVSPVLVADMPKIPVISDSPEKDISDLLLKNELPDEIYIVQVMKLLATTEQNLTVTAQSKEQSIEMTSERLNTLSEVLKKAEETHSYNNTQLLTDMLENWIAEKYSSLSEDLEVLQRIETLNEEAFKADRAKKEAETAKAKVAFIQKIQKAVGEQKELSQEHFKSALENWFSTPHSTKEPYQLTVLERKNIAEKVYPEGTLISLDDVLAEYEKMFSDPEMFTYDRYVALAYYLTSGQNKADSYHFQTFYSLPYFPTEATDKATAAYLMSESYVTLHNFADQLK
jgi:hypothetical protein